MMWMTIAEIAPYPIEVPRCLRCCCCRNTKRTSCSFFYKLLFGHIKQLGIVLRNHHQSEHYWIKSKDKTKLDCMFFKAELPNDKARQTINNLFNVGSNESSRQEEARLKKRPCFILCNSNAMFYQQMVHLSHTFYLKFFLDKGINVMTWNYRSYGRSKGTPSPDNLKEDIEAIYNYMRKEMGIQGKIGVYGRSLGGIPSSYISTKVDMAIIDRSFCNLSAMAYWKYRGHFADIVFKVGTCGWQVQNDFNLLRPS